MGKIVMPKNSALLDEIEPVLAIYYQANDWLENEAYKSKLKDMIGADQYASSYTKKAQITSYFGLTEWEDISNSRSRRRITAAGKKMYQALLQKNANLMREVLMEALENVAFGRDNYGCPDSNSDVEPPVLYIRAILDVGYLTYREFAYLLWRLEDKGGNYTDAISDLIGARAKDSFTLPEEANKYADCKPIMMLVRWGFLAEDTGATGGKHIIIHPEVLATYKDRLRNLKIYNVDKDISPREQTSIDNYDEEPMFTPTWFRAKAKDYPSLDGEATALQSDFQTRFSPVQLKALSGLDLLNGMFLNSTNFENLCRVLEFDSRFADLFGSIKGGNAYKYGLYFSTKGYWVTGSHQKPQQLSEADAITLGTDIRNKLLAGVEIIERYRTFETIDTYKNLYQELRDITGGYIDRIWFLKYYQMIYPSLFAPDYSDYAQRTILNALGIVKEKYSLVRMGQIKLFAESCEMSNVMLNKIFWDYYIASEEESTVPVVKKVCFHTGVQSDFPRNRILFGAPGTGKSFTLNREKDDLLDDTCDCERVTFHPDYTYANFVGAYKPIPSTDSAGNAIITYAYVPGPFMRTYVKALKNSRELNPRPFLLLIEEINRANVAAVFGDVFQLLDRDDDEVSEYPIRATEDMKKYLHAELGGDVDDYTELCIPDNMFIWATMNSADQGVFPMDTAFKRRWDFTYLGIDASESGIAGKTVVLGQGEYQRIVEWNALRKAINNALLDYKVNEDKLMGPYFIAKKNLGDSTTMDPVSFTRIFKNKVLMYLFEDAAKQRRDRLFAGCESSSQNLYSKICHEFDTKGVFVFLDDISNQFVDRMPEGTQL